MVPLRRRIAYVLEDMIRNADVEAVIVVGQRGVLDESESEPCSCLPLIDEVDGLNAPVRPRDR